MSTAEKPILLSRDQESLQNYARQAESYLQQQMSQIWNNICGDTYDLDMISLQTIEALDLIGGFTDESKNGSFVFQDLWTKSLGLTIPGVVVTPCGDGLKLFTDKGIKDIVKVSIERFRGKRGPSVTDREGDENKHPTRFYIAVEDQNGLGVFFHDIDKLMPFGPRIFARRIDILYRKWTVDRDRLLIEASGAALFTVERARNLQFSPPLNTT